MNKQFLISRLLLVMLGVHVYAFTFSQNRTKDSLKQDNVKLTEKYWLYRHRLVTQFLKVGLGENGIASGYSIPAVTAYKSEQEQLDFGDGTSCLGYYIGVLATEHLLLQKDGASQERLLVVKEELYYAMMAYERLDFNAEQLLSPYEKCNINGFFVRDDVDIDTYLINFPTPLDATGVPKTIASDFNDAKNAAPCDREPLRFPTVDQVSNLLVGFALVVKCMGNESYKQYFFKDNAKLYSDIIMKYLQKVDYVIAHPIEHCTVAYAEDARLIAYGLAQAGQAIKDERFGTEPLVQWNNKISISTDYDSWSTFLSSSVWINTLNYPSGKPFFEANFNTVDEDKRLVNRVKETINEDGVFGILDPHDYNNAIVCQLAAIGNIWKIGLIPHNRRVTLLTLKKYNTTKFDDQVLSKNVSLKSRPIVHERKISIPICCYDGSMPQQLVGVLSGVTHRKVPLADLSTQIVTALPTFCMPGHDVLPQLTINTTALALSKYGELSDIQFFAMLHEFLHGTGTYNYDKDFLLFLLNEAPLSGPHYKPYKDPNNPPIDYDWCNRSESEGSPWWRQDNRWEKSSRTRRPDEGSWNGLDYMMAYNLFHLVNGKAYGLKDYQQK